MRKLAFKLFLPILFLVLSAIVLTWATRLDALLLPIHSYVAGVRYLWYALNAPALFFFVIVIHYAPITAPNNLAKLLSDTVLFLSGGVIWWFFVGSILDSRRQNMHPKVPANLLRAAQVSILLWGIYLCWQGLRAASATDYLGRHLPGSVLNGVLVLLWSATLIVLPAKSLLRASRSTSDANKTAGGAHVNP